MGDKAMSVINRLEWEMGDWKEEEDIVIIWDDVSDSGRKGGDQGATSRNQALLTPLDPALVSISQSCNASHLFHSTFRSEDHPIYKIPDNTHPDETAMLIDNNHLDPRLIYQSMNAGIDEELYGTDQVCGAYLGEFGQLAKTGLGESNHPLLPPGVNAD